MLVIEGYLWEDMVVTRDQMATAYLRLGTRAQNLLQVVHTNFNVLQLHNFSAYEVCWYPF
jgi:hypothetical protein